jgi:hypothetical protein
MFEEGVRVSPGLGLDPLCPGDQLSGGVAGPPESQVSPACGAHQWCSSSLERILVHGDEGHVPRDEQVVDLLDEPGGVAKFESRVPASGKQVQKFAESLDVDLEVWRQLKESGTETVTQRIYRPQEKGK